MCKTRNCGKCDSNNKQGCCKSRQLYTTVALEDRRYKDARYIQNSMSRLQSVLLETDEPGLGPFVAVSSIFGPVLQLERSISGLGQVANPITATVPIAPMPGRIGLAIRVNNNVFQLQALNMQNAGAIAGIIYNNIVGDVARAMRSRVIPAGINIPIFSLGNADGLALEAALLANPNITITLRNTTTFNGFNILDNFGVPFWLWLAQHMEPQLAVNPLDPRNMVIATFEGVQASTTNANTSLYPKVFYTLDGGVTWNDAQVDITRQTASIPPDAINDTQLGFDQSVAFDLKGNVYLTNITQNNFRPVYVGNGARDHRVNVWKSTNKGRTWDVPVNVFLETETANGSGNPNFPDKPGIFTDGIRPNNVYIVSSTGDAALGGITQLAFYRSTDGGNQWSDALILNVPVGINPQTGLPYPPAVFFWGADMVTLPDGTLVLAARNAIFDTNLDAGYGAGYNELIYVFRSTDAGETFSLATVAFAATEGIAYDAPNDYIVRDAVTWTDLAVNKKNGYIYMTVQSNNFYPFGVPDGFEFLGTGSIVIMSKDGGFTWTPAAPVNPTSTNSQAYMPTVMVADNGNVGLFYYTDRNHDYNGDDGTGPLETDVYLSLFDKNLNFLGEKRVTETSFDLRKACVTFFAGFNAYLIGDYLIGQNICNDFAAPLVIMNDNASPGPLDPFVPNLPPTDPFVSGNAVVDLNRHFLKFARVTQKSILCAKSPVLSATFDNTKVFAELAKKKRNTLEFVEKISKRNEIIESRRDL